MTGYSQNIYRNISRVYAFIVIDIYFAETRWDFYTAQSILHVYVVNVRLSWTVLIKFVISTISIIIIIIITNNITIVY